MNKIEIEVPINVRYISDWLDFNTDLLKGHSIINKTITGCGFTHYCLTNNIPTILCSPRKFLLENKHEQLPNTYLVINEGEKSLDVDGDDIPKINKSGILKEVSTYFDNEEFIESCLSSYIFNCQVSNIAPKILVTYDSLKHILSVLGETIKFYSVIVDEFQNIFIDSCFKPDTELGFVEILQDCPNVTYLSATPYIEEYLDELDEFKDLPYYELKWHPDRLQTIKVDMRKTINISQEVDKIIQDYINGNFPEKVDENGIVHQSKEVVFYVNSVRLVCSLIKRNNLMPDQVNIICANTDKNKKQLEKIGLEIGKSPLKGDSHKMFTFCTRTTYAGADFYSPSAISVIVSDCKIDSLSTDIRMDFPQIMGRQRLKENVFRDECIFIFKLSDNSITMEEFERRSQEKLNGTNQDILNYKSLLETQGKSGANRLTIDVRWRIKTKRYSEDYTGINEKTGAPTINKLVLISEKRAFELRSNVYKSEVQVYNEFLSSSVKISDKDLYLKRIELEKLKDYCNQKHSFIEKMKFICDLLLNDSFGLYIHISELYWLPLSFRNYLNYLGPERIRANGYREIDIKREMLSIINNPNLKDHFLNEFKVGEKYLLKDIKPKIQLIYNKNNIQKIGKAVDLEEFFNIKEIKIYDSETKKQSRGYLILSLKD